MPGDDVVDRTYVHCRITFVWDETKEQANLRKHGISFAQAAEAFLDPLLRVVDASRGDEARDAVIGLDEDWNLLFVVHVELPDDVYRIVSARRATGKERRCYEG